MELQSVLLLLAVLLLVAVFVSWPFRQSARRLVVDDHARSVLLAERERLLTALQELDFDHSLGKIPEEDYLPQRAELVQQGAEMVRKLEELSVAPVPTAAFPPTARAPVTDDEIEELIARRRAGRKEKTGGFCPNCGRAVLFSDKFCPGCGKALRQTPTESAS